MRTIKECKFTVEYDGEHHGGIITKAIARCERDLKKYRIKACFTNLKTQRPKKKKVNKQLLINKV